MAQYRVRYSLLWLSQYYNNDCRIDILQDGYTGESTVKRLSSAPILEMGGSGAIRGTSLSFSIQADEDGELRDLYTTAEQGYKVEYYRNNQLAWEGYLTAELYSEDYIAPPYSVSVVATDFLGLLKNKDYVPDGQYKRIIDIIRECLEPTNLQHQFNILSYLTCDEGSIMEAQISDNTFMGDDSYKSCYEVLEGILTSINATLTVRNGYYSIVRANDVAIAGSSSIYSWAGELLRQEQVNSLALGKAHVDALFPEGNLINSIIPAKRSLKALMSYNQRDSILLNSNCEKNTDWVVNSAVEKPGSPVQYHYVDEQGNYQWGIYGYKDYYTLDALPTSASSLGFGTMYQDIPVQQDRENIYKLTLRYHVEGKENETFKLMVYVYSAQGTLYLNTNGNWVEEYSEIPVQVSTQSAQYRAFSLLDKSSFTESSIEWTGIPMDGELRVYIANPLKHNYEANWTNRNLKVGGVELVNASAVGNIAVDAKMEERASTSATDVEIAFNDAPFASNVAHIYNNAIHFDYTPLVGGNWSINGSAAHTTLLSTIAHDYAISNALSKMELKGTIFTNDITLLSVTDVYSSSILTVEDIRYNLLEDTADVTLVESLGAKDTSLINIGAIYINEGGGSSSGKGSSSVIGTGILANKDVLDKFSADGDFFAFDNISACKAIHDHAEQLIRPATFVLPTSAEGTATGESALYISSGAWSTTPSGGGGGGDVTKPAIIAALADTPTSIEELNLTAALSNTYLSKSGAIATYMAKSDLLDNGIIKSSLLPSYVDDVLEFANFASFPAVGESGKIYIAMNTNLTYRWGGSSYVEISKSLALGESSSTAYAGDKGKQLRIDLDALTTVVAGKQDIVGPASSTTLGLVKIGSNISVTTDGTISIANYHPLNGSSTLDFAAKVLTATKVKGATLVLPTTTPSLASGEIGIYAGSGSWATTPSSGGSVVVDKASIVSALSTTATSLEDLNITSAVNSAISNSISGKADISWVTNQAYATQTWVTDKGYATSSALSSGLSTKQDKITSTNKLSYTLISGTPTIPTALKSPYSLTFGTKTYDGSSAKTITASDLGAITSVTSSMVTTALGYTPYNSASFTKANIKSTLGIADWALASSKPSYSFSELTSKPTTIAGYGITDAMYSFYHNGTSVNLNIVKPYIMRLTTLQQDAPSTCSYGNLVHFQHTNRDTAFELVSAYLTDNLYYRRGSVKTDGTGTINTNAWKEIIHSGNISSQSVSYASSAGTASKLGDYTTTQIVQGLWLVDTSYAIPAEGWYYIAKFPLLNKRASFKCMLRGIGGDIIPFQVIIEGYAGWSTIKNYSLNVTLLGCNTSTIDKVRIAYKGDYSYLEIHCKSARTASIGIQVPYDVDGGVSGNNTMDWQSSLVASEATDVIIERVLEDGYNGNASTATKLSTPRTIWGQSFDGSGNVDGTIKIGRSFGGNYNEGIRIDGTASQWCGLFLGTDASKSNGYQASQWNVLKTNVDTFRICRGEASVSFLEIKNDGNVGIGTTAPTQKLDVNGTIKGTHFILPTSAPSSPTAGAYYLYIGSGNWATNP